MYPKSWWISSTCVSLVVTIRFTLYPKIERGSKSTHPSMKVESRIWRDLHVLTFEQANGFVAALGCFIFELQAQIHSSGFISCASISSRGFFHRTLRFPFLWLGHGVFYYPAIVVGLFYVANLVSRWTCFPCNTSWHRAHQCLPAALSLPASNL